MLESVFKRVNKDTGNTVVVNGYYHDEYYGMYSPNNHIRFVNVLKNDLRDRSEAEINRSEMLLAQAVREDFAKLTQKYGALTLCGVPRSKKEEDYPWSKMGLKRALRRAVSENAMLSDGLDYIIRHTNTLCTHRSRWGHGGSGEAPRRGLLHDTCMISPAIRGRDILLVDDIYTPGCGIDEDAICAMLDAGARRVVFYALGYTATHQKNFHQSAL